MAYTLPGFAAHLVNLVAQVEIQNHHALETAARIVEREAKAEIGTYQPAAGPFAAWDPLSTATLEGFRHPAAGWLPGKEDLGYAPPDNPLRRAGELHDSYEHVVHGDTAHVGSNNMKAVWQEMGTPNALYPIPPRSVLGGAAFKKKGEVGRVVGRQMFMVLSGHGITGVTPI